MLRLGVWLAVGETGIQGAKAGFMVTVAITWSMFPIAFKPRQST